MRKILLTRIRSDMLLQLKKSCNQDSRMYKMYNICDPNYLFFAQSKLIEFPKNKSIYNKFSKF